MKCPPGLPDVPVGELVLGYGLLQAHLWFLLQAVLPLFPGRSGGRAPSPAASSWACLWPTSSQSSSAGWSAEIGPPAARWCESYNPIPSTTKAGVMWPSSKGSPRSPNPTLKATPHRILLVFLILYLPSSGLHLCCAYGDWKVLEKENSKKKSRSH